MNFKYMLTAFLFLASCSDGTKDENLPEQTAEDVKGIIIGGTIISEVGFTVKGNGAYQINGEWTVIPNPENVDVVGAECLFVEGPSVYLGLYSRKYGGFSGPEGFVWLNGLVSRDYLVVQDISVKDSHLYAVATADGVAYLIDVVGENQSAVRLMGRDTFACTIQRDDNNIYIGGWVDAKPAYWLNGELHELSLPNGASSGQVMSSCIKGSDVYFAGSAWDENDISSIGYWKNGEWVELAPEGAIEYAVIKGIGVTEGGSVVAAVQYDQVRKAGCFVNGQWKALSTSYGENFRITSMSVCGEDYYVLGY